MEYEVHVPQNVLCDDYFGQLDYFQKQNNLGFPYFY